MKYHHAGIFTNHPRRMLNFYTKVLRLKKINQTILPKTIVKKVFQVNQDFYLAKLSLEDSFLEIFWPVKKKIKNIGKIITGFHHICIVVSNKKRFCDRIEKKYRVKVIRIGRGSYFVYFIKDPDGNFIEVRE